jgi:hypothetical protein
LTARPDSAPRQTGFAIRRCRDAALFMLPTALR